MRRTLNQSPFQCRLSHVVVLSEEGGEAVQVQVELAEAVGDVAGIVE